MKASPLGYTAERSPNAQALAAPTALAFLYGAPWRMKSTLCGPLGQPVTRLRLCTRQTHANQERIHFLNCGTDTEKIAISKMPIVSIDLQARFLIPSVVYAN